MWTHTGSRQAVYLLLGILAVVPYMGEVVDLAELEWLFLGADRDYGVLADVLLRRFPDLLDARLHPLAFPRPFRCTHYSIRIYKRKVK